MTKDYYRGWNFAKACRRDGHWNDVEEIVAVEAEDEWDRGVRDFYFTQREES